MDEQVLPDVVTIIAFVRQHQLGFGNIQVKQVWDGLIIGRVSSGQDKAERTPLTVRTGVDFARKAAAASTKAFLMSPPFAPAA